MCEMELKAKYVDQNQVGHSDEHRNNMEKESVKTSRIYLAATMANISAIAVGTCMTWSSPIGPKLESQDTSDSPLDRPVTSNENAWISSIIGIGALITPFIAGPLADKIGRKNVLLSSSIFFILGYILMLIAKEVWVLLVGRIIKGFGCGFVMCVTPIYVGEISNDRTRGATGSFMSFFIACGLYYVLCIGPFVSYMMLQYFCLLVPIILDITLIFMPESPFYLLAKGQREAASKALQFLRGQNEQSVDAELKSIENFVASSTAEKAGMFEIFKVSGNRKAFLITFGLVFFQQVSGIGVVLFYAQTIFESANMNLKAAIASIVVGTVQVISAAIVPFVVNKFRRKVILLHSATFMSISLTTLGYFFFSQIVLGTTNGLSWLPVTSLVVYIIFFNMGFGALPWTILSEIFPSNVRSFAAALTTSACWTTGFFVTLCFPALDALGTYYAFWLFAIFCVLAFLFVVFLVFETKDLSLEEIQKKLNKSL